MGLIDLFKPDWKHGTPEKRQLAVASIEDPATFAEMLANEQVQSVKDVIFRKHDTIESLQRLIPLINGSDKTFLENKLALLQFNASLRATDLSQAYFRDWDAKQLSRLAREAKSVEVQLKAVGLIDDVKVLSSLIQHTGKHVAQVAVENLSDKGILQKLLKSVPQKSVRLLVQERYDALFGEEEKAHARTLEGLAELEHVLNVLEGMASVSDWSSLGEAFSLQLERWQQLLEFSTEDHRQKFHDLCESCQLRKTEYEHMAAESTAKAAEFEARVQQRRLLLHELLEASDVVQEDGTQLLADIKGRWEILEPAESAEEIACQGRFEKALQTFDVKQNRLRDLQNKKEGIQEELQGILSELTALKESEPSSKLRSTLRKQRKFLHSLD